MDNRGKWTDGTANVSVDDRNKEKYDKNWEAEEELTKLRMAISRVMSTQMVITNSRSTTLMETPWDSPEIH